jgi:hypothetical protein
VFFFSFCVLCSIIFHSVFSLETSFRIHTERYYTVLVHIDAIYNIISLTSIHGVPTGSRACLFDYMEIITWML